MTRQLGLTLASGRQFAWAQAAVSGHHYLHRPVDARCSPLAYVATRGEVPIGTLIFGRPEATRVNGWYGSVDDVRDGRCPLTRWQILNLARVWLDPRIQRDGPDWVPDAASSLIAMALRRVGFDYLLAHPPCFPEEPYEIRDVLSYCDTSRHLGTLYRACNFRLVRTNARGLATYARPLRRLTHHEHHAILEASARSPRSQRYRAQRGASPHNATLWETWGSEVGA